MCRVVTWKAAQREREFSRDPRTLGNFKAGVILINDENHILLVQNYDGKWTFPKGGIECGETTEDAALRELFEETGIQLAREHMRFFIKSYKQTYFICGADSSMSFDEALIQDKVEITGIGWFCMEHMSDINTSRPTSRIICLLRDDMRRASL